MKTGLGLYRKYRKLYAYLNLFRFGLRKVLLGFDVANMFIQRVDKQSIHLILRKYGAAIGEGCDIETGQVFHNCRDYTNLEIGNNCHIGRNCFFDLKDVISIGNNVVISMKSTFITHIDMDQSELRKYYPFQKKPIKVGSNVYIGATATILMGTEIGMNSFIAAGSLVSRNVEPLTVVGGVPARLIKKLKE